MPRCKNYDKIRKPILLDEEERVLRAAGASSRADIERIWDARYPHSWEPGRTTILTELEHRLCYGGGTSYETAQTFLC